MIDILYRWPEAARVGSRVPKDKLYEHGNAPTALREQFKSNIARITWAYKLAESTINLPATDDVSEIQVFRIDTKDGLDVSDQLLSVIDKAIPSPIIFEITRETSDKLEVRTAAQLKQLGPTTRQVGRYSGTGWIAGEQGRQPLPTAIDLATLYVALLEPLAEVSARPGEAMSVVADRLRAISKLEREVATLRRKLKGEKQLNRKLELRRLLKSKTTELEQKR
ncbi:hypothetical protein GCM10010910_09480 [Microbacterium nanhaiense]|uniref:DUF4391 domain-containing protein n=1 Tax=Microbacterium nanhaiense TaxID=1301026 RepID=A0ABQ2N0K6_9MICO|nr:DUF4391 domain-containing protein [Microbacterium nanhaiense]GGO61508.1 hypothetical protein GCM10010910_09480 [Microbacterium nanhaiense]